MAAAVIRVAVVTDPAERRARAVLARLGPLGQTIDVAPRSARARDDVEPDADRVLSAGRVTAGRVAVRDRDLVLALHPRDVSQQAAVDALSR
jgi:hypothetical protein